MTATKAEHSVPPPGSGDRDEAVSRLAAIVASSSDAIISQDLGGIVASWNQAAERLFGYTAAEIIGRPIAMIFPSDRVHEEAAILARIEHGERVDRYHAIRCHKDGRPISICVTISPIKDASGVVVGASKIVRDLTDREAVSALVHDAHQPLTAIKNYASASRHLLVSGDTERVASALDRITAQVDRAHQIIERIRNFVQKDEAGVRNISGK